MKRLIPFRDANAAALTGAGTSNTAEFAVADGNKMVLFVNVTAVSGSATPTLVITVQDRDPFVDPTSATAWQTAGSSSFTSITGTGNQRIYIEGFSAYMKIKFVTTGTSPSFTFTLAGVLIN